MSNDGLVVGDLHNALNEQLLEVTGVSASALAGGGEVDVTLAIPASTIWIHFLRVTVSTGSSINFDVRIFEAAGLSTLDLLEQFIGIDTQLLQHFRPPLYCVDQDATPFDVNLRFINNDSIAAATFTVEMRYRVASALIPAVADGQSSEQGFGGPTAGGGGFGGSGGGASLG